MANFTRRESGKWQAKVRREGWPSQSKTFDTKAAAEAWARSVEREMDTDSFISRNDAERTTFLEAAERYRTDVLPSKRGKEQDGYVLKRVRNGLHDSTANLLWSVVMFDLPTFKALESLQTEVLYGSYAKHADNIKG